MKKVLYAIMVVAGISGAAHAQEAGKDSTAVTTTTTTSVNVTSVDQDGYVSIKSDELPDAVKTALGSPDFKGWIINSASYNKKEERYIVELKNGADFRKVKFSADGKELND